MRRRHVLAMLTAAAVAAPVAPRAADAPPAAAKQPIQNLVDTLLATMREASKLGFDGRFAKLEPVLRGTFDFPFMARLAVGPHWNKLSRAQRKRLADKFAQMSIATFASRFDGYNGQTIKVQDPKPGPRDSVFVPTTLTKSDGGTVRIDYLLRRRDDGWRAVDIYLEGKYSELATKRSEFASVLKRKGFDALISRIEARIAEMRGNGDGT